MLTEVPDFTRERLEHETGLEPATTTLAMWLSAWKDLRILLLAPRHSATHRNRVAPATPWLPPHEAIAERLAALSPASLLTPAARAESDRVLGEMAAARRRAAVWARSVVLPALLLALSGCGPGEWPLWADVLFYCASGLALLVFSTFYIALAALPLDGRKVTRRVSPLRWLRSLFPAVLLLLSCATPRPESADLARCVQTSMMRCGPELMSCQIHEERACMARRGWSWIPRTGYARTSETDDARRSREIEREQVAP